MALYNIQALSTSQGKWEWLVKAVSGDSFLSWEWVEFGISELENWGKEAIQWKEWYCGSLLKV